MVNSILSKLRREHSEMKSVLALMHEQLQVVEQGGVPDMVMFGYSLYYMRKFPSVLHHPKEDLMFDRLQTRAPALKVDLHRLREQHRELYELENWLAEVAAQVPKQGAAVYPRLVEFGRRYLRLEREHRETEERRVFPLAEGLLKREDWDVLTGPAEDAMGPAFGARQPRRFRSLFDYIMRQARAHQTIGRASV
jgi:hemerythrin-like domain-containing protein